MVDKKISGLTAVVTPALTDIFPVIQGGVNLIETVAQIGQVLTVQDSTFAIYDNADNTKKAAFEASGITTGTTRTLTVPDTSGTLYVSGNQIAAADQADRWAYKTGEFQYIEGYQSATTTGLVAADTMYAFLCRAEAKVTPVTLTMRVAGTAAASGKVAKMAAYTYGTGATGGQPGALIAGSDTGDIAVDVINTTTSTTVSFNVNPGYFFITFWSNGTPTMVNVNGFTVGNFLGGNGFNSAATRYFTRALVYGTWPGTFGAVTRVLTNPLVSPTWNI